MTNIEKIVNFFKNHPKFPFLQWDREYDDYCSMYLCLKNILEAYIPKEQITAWSAANEYSDFRRNPDGEVYYPLTIINDAIEIVIHLGILKENKDGLVDVNSSIQISRDDRWGDRWENNAPEDEWYNEVAIMLDLDNAESLRKTDFILKTIVQKKQTYRELLKLKDVTL